MFKNGRVRLKRCAAFISLHRNQIEKVTYFLFSPLLKEKARAAPETETEPSSTSVTSPPEAFRECLLDRLSVDDYGIRKEKPTDIEMLKHIKFVLDEVLNHQRYDKKVIV